MYPIKIFFDLILPNPLIPTLGNIEILNFKDMNLRKDALSIFNAAIKAVHPSELLKDILNRGSDHLLIDGVAYPFDSFENLYVIGAGKAGSAMAVSVEKNLEDLIKEGLVITKHGHLLKTEHIAILEAGHPIPDEHGIESTNKTLELLKKVEQNDLVLCLISGGASAIWCDLPETLNLHDYQTTIKKLLNSGADISEMNTVRKHLSTLKGGQLLKQTNGAKVISLIISDVPGDDPCIIASGPTQFDESTFSDALNILKKYDLLNEIPESIKTHLENGKSGRIEETLKPNSPFLKDCRNIILGTNHKALEAAKIKAQELGYNTQINERLVIGSTEIEAVKLCRNLFEMKLHRPSCILQGGETTIKVTGNGKGGRNQHFILTALEYLDSQQHSYPPFCLVSGGTDGTDGSTDASGGIIDHRSLKKVGRSNMDLKLFKANFDSYHYLKEMDSLLLTGPTQTNVMDIMIGLVDNEF